MTPAPLSREDRTRAAADTLLIGDKGTSRGSVRIGEHIMVTQSLQILLSSGLLSSVFILLGDEDTF